MLPDDEKAELRALVNISRALGMPSRYRLPALELRGEVVAWLVDRADLEGLECEHGRADDGADAGAGWDVGAWVPGQPGWAWRVRVRRARPM